MSRPNLWWSYDEGDGSFSALPASPLLLPALVIALVAGLFRWQEDPGPTDYRAIAGNLAYTSEWQYKYRRFGQLLDRVVETGNELSWEEDREYERLLKYLRDPHGAKRKDP